jgi:hypothetical protein
MIAFDEAQKLVKAELDKMEATGNLSPLKISSSRTEEFGWIFFYNTEVFLEEGDLSSQLAGNSPLIVDKNTGILHVTGTAEPIESYINKYKKIMGYT